MNDKHYMFIKVKAGEAIAKLLYKAEISYVYTSHIYIDGGRTIVFFFVFFFVFFSFFFFLTIHLQKLKFLIFNRCGIVRLPGLLKIVCKN